MQSGRAMSGPAPLQKQKSWAAAEMVREEAWQRQKERRRRSRSLTLTDEDVDELKACFELGFGFRVDSPASEPDHQRLSDTFPALGLYYAVNKSYNDAVSKSRSSSSLTVSSSETESDVNSVASPVDSPLNMFSLGDDPKTMKTRLRQWAQVVACSVKQLR